MQKLKNRSGELKAMERISRLPLNALRVLEALARHESMASAADELGVETSAVSMQIRSLSNYLGVALVSKQGRGISLTPAALSLLRPVGPALRQIADALEMAREEPIGRPFRLSVLPSVLLRWMVPLIPSMEKVCAGRRLIITPDKAPISAGRGGIDAAMRLGDGQWPSTMATKLMDEWILPVCAPSQYPQVGWLSLGELPTGAPLLHSRLDSWRLWNKSAPKQASAILIDDAAAVVTAAERGLGVALTRWTLVVDAIREGRLVQIGHMIPYRYSYYWVTPQDRGDDPLDLGLLHVLREAARDTEPTERQRALTPPCPDLGQGDRTV